MPIDPSKLCPAEYQAGIEAYRLGLTIDDNPITRYRQMARESWTIGLMDAEKAERDSVRKALNEAQLEVHDMLREAVTLARNEQLTSWVLVRQRLVERNPGSGNLAIIEAAGQLWRDMAALG